MKYLFFIVLFLINPALVLANQSSFSMSSTTVGTTAVLSAQFTGNNCAPSSGQSLVEVELHAVGGNTQGSAIDLKNATVSLEVDQKSLAIQNMVHSYPATGVSLLVIQTETFQFEQQSTFKLTAKNVQIVRSGKTDFSIRLGKSPDKYGTIVTCIGADSQYFNFSSAVSTSISTPEQRPSLSPTPINFVPISTQSPSKQQIDSYTPSTSFLHKFLDTLISRLRSLFNLK